MRRRGVLETLSAALVGYLGVLLIWHVVHGPVHGTGIGRAAPDFDAVSLDSGRSLSLSQFAGRLVVLNFWASWCGPCKDEAPVLGHLATDYANTVVSFVGVDVRDASSSARAFIKRYHMSYPVLHDNSGEAASLYGVGSLPATFIISPQGRVVAHLTGAVTGRQLRASIERARAATT